MNEIANLTNTDNKKNLSSYTYDQIQLYKKEIIWNNLSTITIAQALTIWFDTLTSLTAKNYISGMKILCTAGLIQSDATLQAFALINHDDIIDRIKNMSDLSESSRQARAACYISFTRFLCRKTQNIINKANPCRDGTAKTFYRVREKVRTQAMTRAQWIEFLQQLHTINPRDCLIAKIILQGGKRMNEVLQLKTDQIDFATGEITFTQSKTKGYEKETVITYPQSVLQELKEYIGSRTGLVFVTSKGHRVMPNQLAVTFSKAGIKANVPFKITPHVLRASTVTYLKREGFADSDIMKVTGHSSATMIHSYDKSERAQNASKKVSLI